MNALSTGHLEGDDTIGVVRRRSRADELQMQINRMLGRLRMAVVYAGAKNSAGAVINQTGNPRSWKSYESVANDIAQSLRRLGCLHVSVIPEDMRLGERLRDEAIHMAWLNTGGVQGYDSAAHAAAALESLGLPYIGHSPLSAAILDNKYVFKRQMLAAGIATAPFVERKVGEQKFQPELDKRFGVAFKDWDGPFIVKPIRGRASLNVQYVPDRSMLAETIETVQAATQSNVLVEGYLPGREYCVAACGPVVSRQGVLERYDAPFAFACVERVLDTDEKVFTSMDISPITTERVRVLSAKNDAEVIERLRQLGRNVFTELGLDTLVRLDVRTGQDGELYVLEANPKPDLRAPGEHVTGIICAGLPPEGMDYDDLILSLLADKIDLLFSMRRDTIKSLVKAAA
jgi:D-alanine-D-alanine ligase